MNTPFAPQARILFQGDSVTDCGRDRNNTFDLGGGYPALIAARLWAELPELNLEVLNRGISGNRVYDLETRWEEDCIQLQPDWVSILIGINDTWRRYDRDLVSPIDEFTACYRRILTQTVETTGAKLILCDPFVLPYPEDRRAWREDLDPRITVVRDLAREFDAIYVPLDGIFAAASARREPAFWAADGVHPTLAGHGLIAKAWLNAVCG